MMMMIRHYIKWNYCWYIYFTMTSLPRSDQNLTPTFNLLLNQFPEWQSIHYIVTARRDHGLFQLLSITRSRASLFLNLILILYSQREQDWDTQASIPYRREAHKCSFETRPYHRDCFFVVVKCIPSAKITDKTWHLSKISSRINFQQICSSCG